MSFSNSDWTKVDILTFLSNTLNSTSRGSNPLQTRPSHLTTLGSAFAVYEGHALVDLVLSKDAAPEMRHSVYKDQFPLLYAHRYRKLH